MTEHLVPTTTPDPSDARRRTRGLVLIALVVGLGLGAAVTSVVSNRDDESSTQNPQNSTAQLSEVQDSCRGWMGSPEGEGSDSAWCTEMFVWMSETSNGSMMGAMMWQDPARMTTACRTWVEQRRDSDAASLDRCTDMVRWMDDRMSRDGGRWMMDDHSN